MKTRFLLQAGLSAVLLCGCASRQQLALKRNRDIIHRYFEEWGNHGDTKAADELIATDVTLRSPPAVLRSLEEYKKGMTAFHTAFPDLHFTVEEMIAEGDKVVVRSTFRGTHKGDLMGIPPTGKQVTMPLILIYRIADDKIVEHWMQADALGLLQQLGAIPAPTPAS